MLFQLSMDVAWSPKCIDERCYDTLALSNIVDFLVVMSYDERSQIHGPCVASANSALETTATGLAQYVELGIPPSRLVMGAPWYGYDYPYGPRYRPGYSIGVGAGSGGGFIGYGIGF